MNCYGRLPNVPYMPQCVNFGVWASITMRADERDKKLGEELSGRDGVCNGHKVANDFARQ